MPENFENNPLAGGQDENLIEKEGANEIKEKGQLTFRSLCIEDCDQMLRIRNEIVLVEKIPFGSRKELTKEEFLSKLQKYMELENSGEVISVAAEIDGNLVGWIAGHLVREKTEIPTVSEDVLAIAKEARGLRISNNLFERWIKRVQGEWGVKKIITATQVENKHSREVHKKRGFKETGLKTTNGLEFVTMEKMLSEE